MSVLIRSACLLALGVGIGRFAYTPILPLMQEQAGMSPQTGSLLATVNYTGYLLGAAGALGLRRHEHGKAVRRTATVTVCLTLFGMPLSVDVATWSALRFLAGVAGAVLFVLAADDLLSIRRGHAAAAWGFGGVGAGIALSGLVTAVVGQTSWRAAWLVVAACGVVIGSIAWTRDERSAPWVPQGGHPAGTRGRRNPWPFRLIVAIYTLEGIGYIIVATFLVAAVAENMPGRLGAVVWVAVGVMALPSCALWTWIAARTRPAVALAVALAAQSVAAVLPAIAVGRAPAAVSGALLGATIIAVPWVALMIGRDTGRGRDVALMTIGYSAGQVLGPVLVAPTLSAGYGPSLLVSAALLGVAAAASFIFLGIRHHVHHPA